MYPQGNGRRVGFIYIYSLKLSGRHTKSLIAKTIMTLAWNVHNFQYKHNGIKSHPAPTRDCLDKNHTRDPMNFKSLSSKLALTAVLSAAIVLPAQADIIALESTRTTGSQDWTGPLGMDFDVLSAIRITQLGAYDSDANGFASVIKVAIFDRNTQLQVGGVASIETGNSVLIGRNRFFDIEDFVLGPGNYSIVADGFSGADNNGNTNGSPGGPTINTGGGLINFTGGARYGNRDLDLQFPLILDGGPANRYDAGTFEFVADVPEPGQLALVGIALAALGAMRRRKQA